MRKSQNLAEARKKGLKTYHGKPCKYGHGTLKYVSGQSCVECSKIRGATPERKMYEKGWRQRNTEHKRLYNRKWEKDHPEKVKIQNRNKQKRHPENCRRRSKLYRKRHPEKASEATAKWRKAHPEKSVLYAATRRATKRNATPPWLTEKQKTKIEELYRMAKLKELLTNVRFDIDHIYPLKHHKCCGLHVPWNLRIIPEKENEMKGNKLPE